ncbi:MAG: RidA family protein [Dehalococcoidia bacterium]|nr:RidA family protein [Dehalococcoidia bacterium]MYI86851.1 RidA family protein [Dehalococcoidia bacterium]
MTITPINPETLHRNPAFSQAMTVDGPHRTVYVGGQNAVDVDGNVVGQGDVAAQAEQVARNLQAALEAAGATLGDVVKLTIYLVEPHSAFPAYGAFQRVWGMPATPPTISLLYVSGLFQPDFLLEVDAVAVVAA